MSFKRKRQTGKGGAHSFIAVPHFILKSPEFGALTGAGVKLLFELAKEYKGNNNGDFSCAFSVLQSRGWQSKGTLTAAKRELEDSGWIVSTRQGGSHRCGLFALTWWPIDDIPGKTTMHRTEIKPRNTWQKNSLGGPDTGSSGPEGGLKC